MSPFLIHLATALVAEAGDGVIEAASEPSPIVGGSPSLADFDSTVLIIGVLDGCSGVMVGPTVVLTAAHCVDDLDVDEGIAVYRGPGPTDQTVYQAMRWGAHPDYCASCAEAQHDIGYVELIEGFIPDDGFAVPVANAQEWDDTMRVEAPVTLVGFGATDEAGTGTGTRREVDVRIDRLIGGGVEFDAGADGKGACRGDSGGPALATTTSGARRLVGNLSRGDCGGTSIYTAPFFGLCWLRDETSLDLLPPECTECDCIEAEQGCACALGNTTRTTAPVLIALLACMHRRRRSSPAKAFGARAIRT